MVSFYHILTKSNRGLLVKGQQPGPAAPYLPGLPPVGSGIALSAAALGPRDLLSCANLGRFQRLKFSADEMLAHQEHCRGLFSAQGSHTVAFAPFGTFCPNVTLPPCAAAICSTT